MLRDRCCSTDDDSSVSFASEAPTPPNHRTPARTRQENLVTPSLASRSSDWIHSGDRNRSQNSTHLLIDTSIAGGGGAADVTARIYSSSASSAESSADEMEELRQGYDSRTRRHGHSRLDSRKASGIGRDRWRVERDELVASFKSQLSMARSQLEQKAVVTRSLQRQLDQVCILKTLIHLLAVARIGVELLSGLTTCRGTTRRISLYIFGRRLLYCVDLCVKLSSIRSTGATTNYYCCMIA